MGLIVETTDFSGKYNISQNTFSELDKYIDKYEEKYLAELFGVTMFEAFKADVTSHAPVSAIYLSLFDPFKEDYNNAIFISNGIKEMLLGFIYFEYVRDQKFTNTVSGARAGNSEVSREAGFDEANIYSRYNEAVETFNTIQWRVNQNETNDYPDYNGKTKRIAWSL